MGQENVQNAMELPNVEIVMVKGIYIPLAKFMNIKLVLNAVVQAYVKLAEFQKGNHQVVEVQAD